ncbi:MAG: endonuclease/exonuclease/phosphatase family protein [Pseudomonadota bacterium]
MTIRAVLTGLTLAALGMSFLGALHPVGDSLAVFRVVIAGGLILLALMARGAWRLMLVGAGLAGIVSAAVHKWPGASPSPGSNYAVLYQKNVFHQNTDLMALAEDILVSNAQVVTLQEMAPQNDPLLARLQDAYPYQHLCRFSRGGTAVLSRVKPLSVAPCQKDYAMARITVDLGVGHPVDVMSVHLAWPFPDVQPVQVQDLLSDLQALDRPVLIGGDFNMVPWSHTLSSVARASGSRRVGAAQTTFKIGPLPISIDHVFAPDGGTTERRALLGSDHFGLRAILRPMDPDRKNPN